MSLPLGKIILMQSLFYKKLLSISCYLLSSVLKVRNRMAVSTSVVYYRDHVSDWDLQLPALPSITLSSCLSLAQEKIKIQSIASTECVALLYHHKEKKIINQIIVSQEP